MVSVRRSGSVVAECRTVAHSRSAWASSALLDIGDALALAALLVALTDGAIAALLVPRHAHTLWQHFS